MALKHGQCLLTEKGIQAFETRCLGKLLRIPYIKHKTNDRVRSETNSFVGPKEPYFWQLASNGNWHGSGISQHATTVSPNPCSRAPGEVGDASVKRLN